VPTHLTHIHTKLDISKESSHKVGVSSSACLGATDLESSVAADGSVSGRQPPLRSCGGPLLGEQGDEIAGCLAEMVEGCLAFVSAGSRWITDDTAGGVGINSQGG
jgi:hypothetical protein